MYKVAASFLLAVLASALLLAIPVYSARRSTQQGALRGRQELRVPQHNEPRANEVRHATLQTVNNTRIYYILAIPAIIAGMPLLLRAKAVRVLGAVLLVGWVVIGFVSVGLFYLPSAIMMILAASAKSDFLSVKSAVIGKRHSH